MVLDSLNCFGVFPSCLVVVALHFGHVGVFVSVSGIAGGVLLLCWLRWYCLLQQGALPWSRLSWLPRPGCYGFSVVLPSDRCCLEAS